VQFVATFMMAFYLVVQENGLKHFVRSITPSRYQATVADAMNKIQDKLGLWLRGQLLLMLIIGVFDYLGLRLLGMDYALILALWAGVTEIIPYVGPILGGIPPVFLALSISPARALWVALFFLVAQQLESNFVVPIVMKRAVGLNPVISISVVLIGARLGCVVGARMAIPMATVAAVVVSDVFEARQASGAPLGHLES